MLLAAPELQVDHVVVFRPCVLLRDGHFWGQLPAAELAGPVPSAFVAFDE